MKEEFIDLSADMTIENGILLSYSGAASVVILPSNINRIGIDAFANKDIESVLLPEGLQSIEAGAFRGCKRLRSIKIPHGVVQIADSAFSGCTSLRYITIPESVLIIGKRVFASHNDGLIVVAKKDSFAYNYANEKNLLVCESEDELKEIIKRASAVGESVAYHELDIFGEKIRVSSSLPVCDEIYEHYKEVAKIISTRIFARQHIGGADFITDVVTDFILAASARVNEKGAITNGTEMLKRVGTAATTLKEGFFIYQKTLLDVTKYEIDKKHARDRFEGLIADFTNELATAEIECLARQSIIHADAVEGLDKKKALEIASVVMSKDECAEVSLALSLKLYPYNPALIRHAIRCGSLCDGLIDLVGLFKINLVGENIASLVDRRDLFGITDMRAFVRSELDKIITEYTWERFTARGVCPASFAQLDLSTCASRESAVELIASLLEKRKAELNSLYEKAVAIYAEAKGKKKLKEAITAFKKLEGYGDSKEKIAEIEAKIKKKNRKFIGIASALATIAIVIGAILFTLGREVTPKFEDYGSYYAVVGYRGFGEDCVIPEEYNGKPVTSIGYEAFRDCTSLTSITIPDSVTSIGDLAFLNCTSLTSVTIPDGVTSIGDDAFSNCTSLESITIPDSVTSIGSDAFSDCTSLTSVTIPNNVTSIGDWAFYNCTSLTSITIPESVTSIGGGAFSNCTSLKSVTIPDSVTSIGNWVFDGCPIENATISTYAIGYIPKENLKTVIISGGDSIGYPAFYNCTSLTSVTISDSVTSIGGSAFSFCTSLTSITIPNSVTSIDSSTFRDCTSLTSITIPNSVTSIGDYAFYDCTSLTSVTIPDSVTSIGNWAFENCTSLTNVTILDSVTSIGDWAFQNCTSLTSVTIPDSVTSIGYRAFYNCTSLESVIYLGTEAEWSMVDLDSENDWLENRISFAEEN